MQIDYLILFLVNFLSTLTALLLALLLSLRIIFKNHIPHLLNDFTKKLGKQLFYQERSAQGHEAKAEIKQQQTADNELAAIVGEGPARMISMLPDEMKEQYIPLIKQYGPQVKMAMELMKTNPQAGQQALMNLPAGPGKVKNSDFQD